MADTTRTWRLPDFIIGGAARSGTTWLYRMLDRHPGIFMSKPIKPEPKFFLVDDIYRQGLAYYSQKWFAAAEPCQLTGEKSTNYLESEAAARRIKQDLPKVKLVFILRDPVGRAISNYRWSCMNGMETEDFATALALEKTREENLAAQYRFSRPHAYFSRGLYADLLRPYLELFPREQVLVLLYEHLVAKPRQLCASLHEFLGVGPRPSDGEGLGVVNPSVGWDIELPPELAYRLREQYREPNQKLSHLLGLDLSIWEPKE